MRFFYDGNPTDLMKGHIIKLLEYFPQDNPVDDRLRITLFENLSTDRKWSSRIRWIMMSRNKELFEQPIIGRVISISDDENWQNTTNIEIEEGIITSDHVFVKAGEKQKGQQALMSILQNQLDVYVKICDPYISPDTLKLFLSIKQGIDILILTDKIQDLDKLKQDITSMKRRVRLKKTSEIHDRFILTKGKGWSVGHSLKDFGKKDSYLSKMNSSIDAENAFDEKWNQSPAV